MTRRRRISVAAGLVAAAAVVIAAFHLGHRQATPDPPGGSPVPSAATATVSGDPAPDDETIPAEGASAEYPSPTSEANAPGEGPGTSAPYSLSLRARARWEPVVIGFGHAFATNHQPSDTKTWLSSLRPLVTPALAAQLAATDPARIPVGTYTGWQLVDAADTQLTVQINYDNGDAVLVDLVTDSQHWAISRIQPT